MNNGITRDEWYEKQCIPSYWSKKHKDREEVINHFLAFSSIRSKQTREETATDLNVSYGVSNCQKIDYFYWNEAKERSNNTPVFVYIHGGYFVEGNKEIYSFVTSVFTKHNFNCAVIGYDLVPTVSVQQILTQTTHAIEAIHDHFNQSQLIICGHSAGAFLTAGISLARPSLIQNIVLVSGVYDLSPLVHTSLNEDLQLTTEQADDINSILLEYNSNVHTHIYVGADESPWSIKESQTFYEKLQEKGIPCTFKIVPDEDHFSIIENLVNEDSVMTREVLKLGR